MALEGSFPPLWVTDASDEGSQRRALAWRVSCVRWLCVLVGLALNRSPLSSAVYAGVALYNIVPFWFTPRFTMRHLRRCGGIILALDGIALMLTVLQFVQQGNYPLPLLLLFFEASLIAGFEPPRIAVVSMTVTTLAVAAYGASAIPYGETWRDVLLWTLLCLFLGIRGALIAQRRWHSRQRLWAVPVLLSAPSSAVHNAAQTTVPARDVAALSSAASAAPADASPNPLSQREREVLTLVARGLSNEEIADRLFVAKRTVGTHMERIARKLNARNRCHAVVIALARHWIEQPPPAAPDTDDTRPS